jgi:hypothetical protein
MPEAPRSETPPRPLLVLAAASVFVVLSYAAVATVLMAKHTSPVSGPTQYVQPVWAMPSASPAASVLPAPSNGPLVGGVPQPVSTRLVQTGSGRHPGATTHHSAPITRSSAPAAASSSPPAAPLLVIGSTVGLGPRDMPGYRLRHRNFYGRVDYITAASSSLDRMDSRFVVRDGRGDARCVSLESVNYPGYFLRHRDGALRLDRAATGSFDLDATFCPVAVGDGFALRSANYPDRHLVISAGWARLERTSAGQATTFRALPPL